MTAKCDQIKMFISTADSSRVDNWHSSHVISRDGPSNGRTYGPEDTGMCVFWYPSPARTHTLAQYAHPKC